jgi:hypothetical protein
VIKYILLGLWICAVTLGSSYGVILWQAPQQPKAGASDQPKVVIEQVQTKRINVPVIANGALKGYVLAQFAFDIDAAAMKDMKVRPDIYLVDEAFKVIYSGTAIDFRDPQKPDFSALGRTIKDNVNARFGPGFVQEVLVQELTYLPQERFRGGALRGSGGFA